MAINQITARGITSDDESVANSLTDHVVNQVPANDAWNAVVIQPKVWPPEGTLFERTVLAEAMEPIAHERMYTIYEAKRKKNAGPFKFDKVPVNRQGVALIDDWQKDESQKLTLVEAREVMTDTWMCIWRQSTLMGAGTLKAV